ncbi:MAG: isochorismatase family cysteine hydrolase [Pseudomonadota bacterium]|nr:isochorismatase family cysteine hydrolase [Pseudomonadota bacterium]
MPHKVEVPNYVIERIMAKRGKLYVFDKFDPTKTALVVIDMQNFFVAEVETAISICPNINHLADAVRSKGGVVAWVQLTVANEIDGPSNWPIYHDYFFTSEKMKAHKNGLTNGSEGHAMFADLVIKDEDIVTLKNRFSAFIQGSSNLHAQLKEKGIQNLFVAGTATNFCCETTARDAMMMGYRTVMVSDANAARYDEDHLAGLTTIWQSFGDVRTVDDCINTLLAE